MLKIEKESRGQSTVIKLTGRIQSNDLGELRTLIVACETHILLDLLDVTLVDVDVIRFLSLGEGAGIELLHCAPYVREWITRERSEGAQE